MSATLESVTLESIAKAVADELQLGENEHIKQVIVIVTCEDEPKHEHDWLDDWYEEYVSQHKDEIPF